MNHTRLIAQIKLRETQRQRDRLHRQYDAIEASVAQAGTPLDRLRALHKGLREVTFAQKPLHPDVRELDALYLADELGPVPPELVADRTRFLERELAQGRLRAEFTHAFGRILSEWAGREGQDADPHEPATDPLAVMWTDPPVLDRGWLDRLFAGMGPVLEPIVARVEEFARSQALAPVKSEEVSSILHHLSRDPYLQPELRRQAAELKGSQTQLIELAGVTTILLNSLDEWDWPGETPLRAVWVRSKHRPYLDEDLLTALFLQVVGLRWGAKLKALLVWENLREGKKPLILPSPPIARLKNVHLQRLRHQAERFLPTIPFKFPQGSYRPQQGVGYGPYVMQELFLAVEREVRFARAAYPDSPLYAVQTDLRDFYPSLSHDLILEVMRRLGTPDRWLAFFGKFLHPRVRYRGEARPIRRGVALEHALSDLFGECVLWLLDVHVYRATGTTLFRVVDDTWSLTDSHEKAVGVWREVQAFCAACGLEVNEAKSGSVCIGEAQPRMDGLPAGRPRWGLLRLRPDATWDVDEAAFASVEEVLRREAAASSSVLALVARYNGYLRYMLGQLALSVALPGDHLRRLAVRLNRMHEGLFGPGHGLVEEVSRRLQGSFADARLKEQGLPHALIYWPITAGGLALAHPLLHVASYLRGRKEWQEVRLPTPDEVAAYLWRRRPDARKESFTPNEYAGLIRLDLDRTNALVTREQLAAFLQARESGKDEALPSPEELEEALAQVWGLVYDRLAHTLMPSGPPPLPAMERLVEDFIQRGGEVSGQAQAGLSPYWRWIIYTYGPSLLEALGTFRFLMTELVPLQLILENRGVTAMADEQTPPADARPVEIPF